MVKKNKNFEGQMLEKLDKILRVLSIQIAPGGSITERARILKLAGLENQEIADILNVPITSVRTLTSKLKR